MFMTQNFLELPYIKSMMIDSQYKRDYQALESVLNKMKEGLDNKEIVNPQFEDVKYCVNRFVEAAFKATISERYLYAGKYESLPKDLQYLDLPYSMHAVGALYKKQLKFEQSFPDEVVVKDLRKVLDEIKPLYDAFSELKTYVVKANVKKKQMKEEAEKQEDEYMKKMVSHKDAQKVIELLKSKAKDIHQEIYNGEMSYLKSVVSGYLERSKEKNTTDYYEIYSNPVFADVIAVLQSVTKKEKQKTNPYLVGEERNFSLVDNYEEILSKQANQHANYVVDRFVYKNTSKVAYILNEKNNMKQAALENVNIKKGVIECNLKIDFDDASSFVAYNSVVLSYSKYGKPFYRYPTTFTNVFLPGGVKMKDVSEQTMEEVFAKAKLQEVQEAKRPKPN